MTYLSRKLMERRVVTALAGIALLGAAFALNPDVVISAPEVPVLVSAYKAAAKNPANPGITATVTLRAQGLNPAPPMLLTAEGPLALEGDLLSGRLPMTFENMSPLEKNRNKLFFSVSKTGFIGLQWLVDDKPRQGEPVKVFETDVAGNTLTQKLKFNGVVRYVKVTFQRKMTFMPGGVILLTPTATPKPFKPIVIGKGLFLRPTPTPTPKPFKPIIIGGIKLPPKGRQVKVTARFVVTNADDGVGGIFGNKDTSVEMGGSIMFGGQIAFDFKKKSASAGAEFDSKAMNSVRLTYSDPDYRFFPVRGEIYDRDTASSSDTLWLASEKIDLIKIMESGQEYRIKGDHNSESGDLYIRVVDEGEFR